MHVVVLFSLLNDSFPLGCRTAASSMTGVNRTANRSRKERAAATAGTCVKEETGDGNMSVRRRYSDDMGGQRSARQTTRRRPRAAAAVPWRPACAHRCRLEDGLDELETALDQFNLLFRHAVRLLQEDRRTTASK